MSVHTTDSMSSNASDHNHDSGLEEGEIPCFQSASDFHDQLPEVVLGSLPEEDRSCSICQEPYGTGEVPETILILPCKHMFGSACIHHWLALSNKNTCPLCRTVFFEIDADESYEAQRDIRNLSMTGTYGNFFSVFIMAERLIQAFPTLLRVNRASWNGQGPLESRVGGITISRGSYTLASVQLWELFVEISRARFRIPPQYIDSLGSLMGRLAHDLREPLQEMRVTMLWSAQGLPTRVLCDPEFRGMVMISLNRMVNAEERWVMSGSSARTEIQRFVLDRRAQDHPGRLNMINQSRAHFG